MFKLESKIRGRVPNKNKYWWIVEKIIKDPEATYGDLAIYIPRDSKLYGVVESIRYYYDNGTNAVRFIVRTIKDIIEVGGERTFGCYCGHDVDYIKEPLLNYINGQISDGWGSGGIRLMSLDNKVKEVFLTAACFA